MRQQPALMTSCKHPHLERLAFPSYSAQPAMQGPKPSPRVAHDRLRASAEFSWHPFLETAAAWATMMTLTGARIISLVTSN